MLKRSLFVVALTCACSPAVVPAASPSASSPRSVGTTSVEARAVSHDDALASRPHRARHVARLSPPFAASGLSRRVPDSEPMTAFAEAP